jgi:hypothetical protein
MAMTDVEEASRLVNRHLLRHYHTGGLLWYPLSQVMRTTLFEGQSWSNADVGRAGDATTNLAHRDSVACEPRTSLGRLS